MDKRNICVGLLAHVDAGKTTLSEALLYETGDGVVVLTTGAAGSKDKYGIYKVCSELNAYLYPLLQTQ